MEIAKSRKDRGWLHSSVRRSGETLKDITVRKPTQYIVACKCLGAGGAWHFAAVGVSVVRTSAVAVVVGRRRRRRVAG